MKLLWILPISFGAIFRAMCPKALNQRYRRSMVWAIVAIAINAVFTFVNCKRAWPGMLITYENFKLQYVFAIIEVIFIGCVLLGSLTLLEMCLAQYISHGISRRRAKKRMETEKKLAHALGMNVYEYRRSNFKVIPGKKSTPKKNYSKGEK